ncbi:MAG: VacJ family lipoprotein [Methyloglobulus sp.]
MMKPKSAPTPYQILCTLLIANMLQGCSTSPTTQADHKDPWESWNRDVHSFNHDVDEAVLKPVAKGYQDITPNPVDESITNVFSNINDIGVFINDFLQLKFTQGGMDVSRFLVNTTAGVAGIFDVAKMIDLPKHDEDFGQTLGFWGIPSGSYMVLPFLGSTSPRDTVGLIGDALFNPLTYVSFFGGFAANAGTAAASAVDITDTRSDLMSSEKILNEAAVDRYDFTKNAYLQRREYLIHDGNPPEETDDMMLDDGANGDTGNSESKSNLSSTGAGAGSSAGASIVHDPNAVTIINNSTTMPKEPPPPAPVINNSKHFLDLSPPDEENEPK